MKFVAEHKSLGVGATQGFLGGLPFVLAQLPAFKPGSLEIWLVDLAATLTIVLLVKHVFTRQPPITKEIETKVAAAVGPIKESVAKVEAALGEVPSQLRIAIRPVQESVDGLERRLDMGLAEIHREVRDADKSCEERTSGVHERSNDLLHQVGVLMGKLDVIMPEVLRRIKDGK